MPLSASTPESVCSSARTRTCGCAHAGFILQKGELIAEVLSDEAPKWTSAILGGTDDYDKVRGQIRGEYIPGTGPPSPNPLKTDYTIKIRAHP
jgi:hypothetical protein